ncbi:MAG: hypothetical protein HY058_16835, partial [Proteobacteria bacterium]|nr:hypothetical protein [Pseudomonadota bacterium]
TMVSHEDGQPEDRRIRFRVGVNVGDIVIDGEDILGDGVNIAARLEQMAEPGGVSISSQVYDSIRGRIDLEVEDTGDQTLKNIDHRVRVYRVRVRAVEEAHAGMSERPALPLPDKPSIAVLPFQNLSGDPEQEYFCDGMVEEIITGLSRIRWLFVIARNSSFTYKGKPVDVKQVGRDLGVRYVLEGSVRKAGQRVRITAQLIDATGNVHLWADKFEGALDDVFALQDQVTASVVGILGPTLQRAEMDRTNRKPTTNLDAYDLYLKGLSHYYRLTDADIQRAYRFAKQAADMDYTFALALTLMALCQHQIFLFGFAPVEGDPSVESVRLARLALNCDPLDADVRGMVGFMLSYYDHDTASGLSLTEKAINLNPNSARARAWGGWVHLFAGDAVQARVHFLQAIRLSPLDPNIGIHRSGLGGSHLFEKKLDEALPVLEAAIQEITWPLTYRFLAATLAHLGRVHEAHETIKRLLLIQPDARIASSCRPYKRRDQAAFYGEGLRIAGLPE